MSLRRFIAAAALFGAVLHTGTARANCEDMVAKHMVGQAMLAAHYVAAAEKSGMKPADINAGVYVLEREAMGRAPASAAFSLERDLFPALVAEGRLKAVRLDGFFVDIGIPEAHAGIDRDPSPLLGRSA